MKKVIKIFGFSFILIIVIVSAHYYGFFTRYNYLTAKWDAFNGNYQILVFGEPDITRLFTEKEKQAFKVQYGYHYNRVAGCSVTQSEYNGIENYNRVMEEEISAIVCVLTNDLGLF